MSLNGRNPKELSPLCEEYRVLEARHRMLNALVPHIEGCTGIFLEMAVLEKRMRVIRAGQKSK